MCNKSWRALRENHLLWTDLVVKGVSQAFPGYNLQPSAKAVLCCNDGLQRLISWLPSLSSVTKLSLDTGLQ